MTEKNAGLSSHSENPGPGMMPHDENVESIWLFLANVFVAQ